MKQIFLALLTVCILFNILPLVTSAEDHVLVQNYDSSEELANSSNMSTTSSATLVSPDQCTVSCAEEVDLAKEINADPNVSAASPVEEDDNMEIVVPDEPLPNIDLFHTLGKVNDRPAFGIDVSDWQGWIDWEAVAPYIDFAMIQAGCGVDVWYQDDITWEYNASECERLGIPYGVYLYSYSQSYEQSVSEVKHILRLLEGHHPTLPVYIDLEDDDTVGTLPDSEILEHVTMFCDAVEAAGFQPGVYANYAWQISHLYSREYDRWPRWVAQWKSDECECPWPFVMWQYGLTYLPGIEGEVDADYLYSGLPECDEGWHCGGGPACPGYGFYDMPEGESWKHAGIDFCLEHGLMNGVSSNQFSPDAPVTRGQIVAVFHRLANSPQKEYEGRFTDVERGEWYTQAVEWAAENGIVKGVSADSFHPMDCLTREQLAVILYRCFGSVKAEGDLSEFSDAEDVRAYAWNAMVWATSEGIIKGVEDDGKLMLCPDDYVTRAQLASIIMRCMK